jgi:hypothetical protein
VTAPARPACPVCAADVDVLQDCYGVVAAYPCNDWLTPAAAHQIARAYDIPVRENERW